MSLDRRLRDAFDRAASEVDPRVEMHLEQTLDRGSRRHQVSVVGTILAASSVTVALIVAIQVLGTQSGGIGEPSDPSPADSGSLGAIAGTYTVTLLDLDPAVAASNLALAGTWSMTLEPSGAIALVPPATFDGSRAAGHTFSIDGSTLRTDLFYNDYCSSIGTYRWEATPEGLALTVVDDDCEIRQAIMATRDWVRGNR